MTHHSLPADPRARKETVDAFVAELMRECIVRDITVHGLIYDRTWAEREREAVAAAALRPRLRRAVWAMRLALADRLDPHRYDEWD